MSETSRKILEAEEFRIVDEKGMCRASIKSASTWNGEPFITLYDENGANRLNLQLHDGRPQITLYSPSGAIVAGLGVHEEGGTTFFLGHDSGVPGFTVRVPSSGGPIVQHFNSEQQGEGS